MLGSDSNDVILESEATNDLKMREWCMCHHLCIFRSFAHARLVSNEPRSAAGAPG
jgi:hypothetical protein